MQSSKEEKNSEIWAVGGGKGGTGKSFLASSMAIHLANIGYKVTLVDVDIGAANLHSFLGIAKPRKTLSDFFEKKIPLEDLKIHSGIKNLSFIAGDIKSLSSDSIRYSQKLKLFRHIRKLNSRYVIVDVGAGSHNLVIDNFLIADKKIAVLTPEILSLENLYHFIKNALFRKLKNTLEPYGFKEFVELAWKNRENYGVKNLWDFIVWLRRNFPFIEEILDDGLSNFKIYLILNKITSRQDIAQGLFIKSGLKRFLNMEAHYLGYVETDENVVKSVFQHKPFMEGFTSSPVVEEIQTCVENLIQEREPKV